MSEHNQTNNNGALEKLDSRAEVNLGQLGQLQYSFLVDQVPNGVANTPASVAVPVVTNLVNESSDVTWIHPSDETLQKESQTDPTFKYQKEFAERCVEAAAEASGDEQSELTIAGAIERQVNAGFSARFNF